MKHIPNYALPLASANFETRQFKQLDDHTLHIQPTIVSLAIRFLVVLVGLGLLVFWCITKFSAGSDSNSIYILLMSALFTSAGLYSYYTGNEQVIINHEIGAAFIRTWLPAVPDRVESTSRHIDPTDIVAVQIVSKAIRTSESQKKHRNWSTHYTEYQINLCTADTNRVNAFVTLRSDNAIRVAHLIAEILEVELVDHINANRALIDHVLRAA